MVVTKCVGCGTEIEHYPSQPRKYCSRQCRFDTAAPLPERRCVACGQQYIPTSARQLNCTTCSPTKGARARLRRYRVSAEQWAEMVAEYDGQCWLCRSRPATCLDHDHETGEARGALCRTCNMALHYLEDSKWMRQASYYLGR